jgi:hypothetical protein
MVGGHAVDAEQLRQAAMTLSEVPKQALEQPLQAVEQSQILAADFGVAHGDRIGAYSASVHRLARWRGGSVSFEDDLARLKSRIADIGRENTDRMALIEKRAAKALEESLESGDKLRKESSEVIASFIERTRRANAAGGRATESTLADKVEKDGDFGFEEDEGENERRAGYTAADPLDPLSQRPVSPPLPSPIAPPVSEPPRSPGHGIVIGHIRLRKTSTPTRIG